MLHDRDHSWVQTAKADVTKPDNIPQQNNYALKYNNPQF